MSANSITTNNTRQALESDATPPAADYQAVAAEMLKALDAIEALMPKFSLVEQSESGPSRRRRRVPLELVESAVRATMANPPLQGVFNLDQANDVLAFHSAFQPVFERLTTAANVMKFTLDVRLVDIAKATRQVYAVAQAVAKWSTGAAQITSHVDFMKKNFPETRKRNRLSSPPTAPTPTAPMEKAP